jgi:hypothetical protein
MKRRFEMGLRQLSVCRPAGAAVTGLYFSTELPQ